MVVLADLLLLFALFVSANLALAWAEVASIPMHADKSGLAGLGGVILFMPMRWLALAAALWIGTARGAFAFLPGSPRWHPAQVLAVHLALGVLSYRAFDWVVAGIQRDDPSPQRFAWLFGLAIPIVVFLAAAWAVNRRWAPRHLIVTVLAAAGIVAAHLAGWRSGYRR